MCETVAPKLRIAPSPRRASQGRRQRHPALQLKRGGDPVPGLELVGAVGLPVRVQVDEAGRDDQARDVHHNVAREGILRNRDDLRAANPHVADRVEARFGIHDAPPRQDDVVAVLRGEGGGGGEGWGGEGDGQQCVENAA